MSLHEITTKHNLSISEKFINDEVLHPEFKKQKISIYDNGFYWKDDGIHEVTRTDIKLNDIEISIKKS